MSKNFELLQRLEAEEAEKSPAAGVFTAAEAPALSEVETVVEVEGQILHAPQGMVRDEFGKLIERVFASTVERRSVVFAGVERRTGCSWLAAHAAQILAGQRRGSVCLVDANLRFPTLHDLFGVENHYGLTEALLDSRPMHHFTRQLPVQNLWLLSSGSPEKSAPALLETEALKRRIVEARNAFDFVIVDSPALNIHSDAIALGIACKGLALILKANSSRKEAAQRILRQLEAAKVALVGAVLNQRTFPVPQAIYSRL